MEGKQNPRNKRDCGKNICDFVWLLRKCKKKQGCSYLFIIFSIFKKVLILNSF